MSQEHLVNVLRQVRQLVGASESDQLDDAQLLDRFVNQRDEAAFEALVERYGRLVLSVCQRVLHHGPDADDAFQTTFLVLACRAGSISQRESLASWLYTVAYHSALRLRADNARRQRLDGQGQARSPADPLAELTGRELCTALDEELARLPSKYRTPLVLCCLEGRSRDEAARQLGWTLGTVRGRLERGRQLLRSRLARRGLTLPAVLAPAFLSPNVTSAAGLSRLAFVVTSSGVAHPSARVASLADGVLRSMRLVQLKTTLAVVLTGCLIAGGAGVLARHFLATSSPAAPAAASDETDAVSVAAPAEGEKPAGGDRFGDALPPGARARLGTVRFRQGAPVQLLQFSPDRKLLTAGGADVQGNAVRLFDTASGREVRRFAAKDLFLFHLNCLASSPDGRLLAAGGTIHDQGNPMGVVVIWETATGKVLHHLRGHQAPVTAVAFSPQGTTLASGTQALRTALRGAGPGGRGRGAAPRRANPAEDETIRLWDVPSGQEIRALTGQAGPIAALVFSPDGKLVVSASGGLAEGQGDRTIRLWEVASGREIRRWEADPKSLISLALSPDGRLLASGSSDGIIRLWELPAGKEVHQLRVQTWGARALAFSPDGRVLATGGDIGPVRLWEPATGKVLRSLPVERVEAVAFATDGRVLATGGDDHTVRLWDLATGQELHPGGGHQGPVSWMGFTRDGQVLTASRDDQTVRRWDPATGRPLRQLTLEGEGNLYWVAFAPDGKRLATAHEDKTLRIRDLATGKELARCQGNESLVRSMAFSPDGKRLASGGMEKVIRLWDAVTGKALRQFPIPEAFYGLAFAPDGGKLAYQGLRGSLRVWDVDTGKELFRQDQTNDRFVGRASGAVAFSVDGKVLAQVQAGKVQLWDLATGKELRRLEGRPPNETWTVLSPSALAFSPDGKTLAVGGWDDRLILFEMATGQIRHAFTGHPGRITAIAFSPDGRTLVSGSDDTTALVWDWMGQGAAPASQAAPTAGELEAWWADLAERDSTRAYQAMSRLLAAPRQSLPFLKEHVRPVPSVAPQRLAALLAGLDADQYAHRNKAAEELAALGEAAEPALRQALEQKPNPEVSAHLTRLLQKLHGPERLRRTRVMEVLEHLADPGVDDVLKRLAGGLPEAGLTQEAAAARKRRSPN